MDLIGVNSITMPRTRADIVLTDGVRPLGGGTWLFSEAQPGLTGLVDLTALGWAPLAEVGDRLVVAATCTIRDLVAMPMRPDWPAQALFRLTADSLLASFKIWNLATVGGNICTALPAGAMTSLMSSLDAEAVVWGQDGSERRMPVADLVTGVRQTALATTDILRSVEVPSASLRSRVAFRRVALSNLGRSGALVIGRLGEDGGFVVTVTAATARPAQLRFDGVPTADELAHAVDAIDDWYDDPHGAPDWRRAVSTRFAEEIRQELEGGAA